MPIKFTNTKLAAIDPEQINDFEDLVLILETASKTYRHLMSHFWELFKRVDNGFWDNVYPTRETIAKDVGCCTKTVDRFNRDVKGLVKHVKRSVNSKQTSNVYYLNPRVKRFFRLFDKVGLFKSFDWDFIKQRLNFLRDIWNKCGQDWKEVMNILNQRKSLKHNRLMTSYEHSAEKMSLGFSQKCPSNSYYSYPSFRKCTLYVPENKLAKADNWFRHQMERSLQDLAWYAQRKEVKNPIGFLKSRLKEHIFC